MQGWVKMHRRIVEHDIWNDVTTFRLFSLLIFKASHKDGVKVRGIEINRGQYLRSYSKLAEDLEYKEGRGYKKVAKSTVLRSVRKLVEEGMVSVRETEHGTLFTVCKYQEYQGFDGDSETLNETDSEPLTERTQNEPRTNTQQEQELKNLRTKESISTTSTTAAPAPQVDGFAKALQTFEANICRLGPIQMESLGKWFDDFDESYEIIEEAIKIAADSNKKTFRFVEYLLKEWASNKLQTIDQVRTYERNKFNNAPAKQGNNNQPRPSYRNKPMREELLPEWFGKPEEEPARETVPPSNEHLEAEKQKLLAKLAARRGAGHEED
ncbi:DnaD domain protein [Planococcus sp. A6]|uniref:DnaD domain-containing protein n=1 Tax=Planococcus sp. A6 TaxID=2992760 RepID=UPI00237A11C2|nr:DnaD domain protein [Planococcus sp. A6]MDE0581526.1 DnaD domain protein [Planococcus sp. A6]